MAVNLVQDKINGIYFPCCWIPLLIPPQKELQSAALASKYYSDIRMIPHGHEDPEKNIIPFCQVTEEDRTEKVNNVNWELQLAVVFTLQNGRIL